MKNNGLCINGIGFKEIKTWNSQRFLISSEPENIPFQFQFWEDQVL